MNPFIVFKQSLPIAVLYYLQSLLPAIVAVSLLPIGCAIHTCPFPNLYAGLGILTGILTFLIVKPPQDFTARLSTNFGRILQRIAVRWAVVVALLLFVGFATQFSEEFSRAVITGWILVTPVVAAMLSVGLAAALRFFLMAPENVRTAVVAGLNDASLSFAKRIGQSPEACMEVRGFFDDRSVERLGVSDDSILLGSLSDLADYVNENNISVIFIALPMRHVSRVMDLLDDLRDTTVSIYYVPDVFVFDLIQARTGEIVGTPVVAMCETPFYGYRGMLKRLTDIGLAAIVFVAIAPVMLLIAILIKLTSPGSIIFKQRRYGLDGNEIVVYKFRTMTVSEDGADFKQATRDDPRITPVGKVLRKYSLDELPQIFNVMQGRMSLVGPRPHAVAQNEEYRKLIKGYMVRHKVLPGITGLAQVNGCRGETARIEEMQARIEYDLEYLRTWTPWLDVKILFLTFFQVFGHEKAY